MIERKLIFDRINAGIKKNPVTALLGPRQCGKTTIARAVAGKFKSLYFDLENPLDEAKLNRPQLIFDSFSGIIVLDEIQRKPDLLPLLRVYSDKKPLKVRFLILGSASPELIKESSESLAGRIHFVDMAGFSIEEVGVGKLNRLWVRGGFPKSFLSKNDSDSLSWRHDFIKTFLERDVLKLGLGVSTAIMKRFWGMITHYHGQIWNGSEIGSSIGVSHTTAQKYLDALTGTYMIRQLSPFYENMGKRLIKSPKIYLRDSGIFHAFLNLSGYKEMLLNPKIGASWEGFACEEILNKFGERDSFFWRTYNGAELDLLLLRKGKKYGFEFKCSDAPVLTKSMKIAIEDLKLEHLWVVYPGKERYSLDEKCTSMPLTGIETIQM
jgi:predicted AAA+ superfamily ATPase